MPEYHGPTYNDGEFVYNITKLHSILDEHRLKKSSLFPVVKLKMSSLIDQLSEDVWNACDRANEENPETISPMQVIKNGKSLDVHHWSKIAQASLKYPILMDTSGHVVDGFHRLAKAYLFGRKVVDVITIPEWIMQECILNSIS